MNGFNKVTLLGNLGADPDLRYTQSGQAVLSLRLATSETYLDKDKVRRERTDWHTVVIWGPRGEALSKYLRKGSKALIEGSLRTSSYEKDGLKRYKTEIHAKEVCLISDGGRQEAGGGEGGSADEGDEIPY